MSLVRVAKSRGIVQEDPFVTVSHELGIDEESLHNVLVQHLPSLSPSLRVET
jgi:hypothetical protein